MVNAQDKEFATFGIVNNKLKAGLILGLLSFSLVANVYQSQNRDSNTKELYEKMLERADKAAREQTELLLKQPIANINRATARVDTAVSASVDAAKTADSAGRAIIDQHKKTVK